jgi:hypothetical protein
MRCDFASYLTCISKEGFSVSTTPEKTTTNNGDQARFTRIDRTAPAGSENSLGAQSVRDGRPATDDGVVEAIDEEGPGTSAQGAMANKKSEMDRTSRQPEEKPE